MKANALKLFYAGTLVLALLPLSACNRRSKAPDLGRMDEEAIAAVQQPVNIFDRKLRNRVAADIMDAQRLPDGRLKVRAQLRNSTKKDLYVIARTVFKDDKALSTGDETPWENLFLAPQQPVTYEATSRETDAATYTVEVRLP